MTCWAPSSGTEGALRPGRDPGRDSGRGWVRSRTFPPPAEARASSPLELRRSRRRSGAARATLGWAPEEAWGACPGLKRSRPEGGARAIWQASARPRPRTGSPGWRISCLRRPRRARFDAARRKRRPANPTGASAGWRTWWLPCSRARPCREPRAQTISTSSRGTAPARRLLCPRPTRQGPPPTAVSPAWKISSPPGPRRAARSATPRPPRPNPPPTRGWRLCSANSRWAETEAGSAAAGRPWSSTTCSVPRWVPGSTPASASRARWRRASARPM
mmetsp:Transcript_182/g.697  ORF Transcript_182/g.697 Transcript_182/m.697 type:complete len:275 (+) Transcript_182:666-1490(+)